MFNFIIIFYFIIFYLSPSISPIVPIPIPAKYNAAGPPIPPAPIINTLVYEILVYPLKLTSDKIIYLEYLSICNFVRILLN